METIQPYKLRRLRGYLAVFLTGALFIGADLVERTVIVALIKIKPSARDKILHVWQRAISRRTVGIVQRFGGVPFEINAAIPWGPGVLVVMNHQSLIDIPIAFLSVVGGYSRIITRERYRRGIPLVSHMVKLYDHPTVRPGERMATEIHRLRALAENADRPIVIFPEGRRSRDGKIGRFRTAGLKTLLSARSWTVYGIVVDGLWRLTSIGEFVANVGSMQVTVEQLGPFDFNHETDDADGFVADLENWMHSKLEEMRHTRENPHAGVESR